MMALVTHSYIWNRYAAKTFFACLTKIERREIILSIEYSIIFIAVFVDKLQNQESCMHKPSALTMLKKVGNFHFLCVVQVTRIYIAVEETLLGFVLASKRVPRCKKEAVL